VTGNKGFIGPVLTRLAQGRGHHVTGLDIGYFESCVSRPQADGPAGRQIVRDIRDVIAADLDGIDAIIHLAGLSNDPMGELNPGLTYAINLEGTLNLARLAKAAGVARFVFASSCSIYGAAGGAGMLDETAPLEPVSAYAISKARSEAGLLALADADFSPVFMRNATAYGLGPRPRFDLVVNNLAGWAFTTGVVRVMSDGTPWRPLVHIEDISLAAVCAAEAPRDAVHGQAFNIGRSDANYRVKDIAQAVLAAFPQARLDITGETGGDPRSYRVDFAKALTTLPGFAPIWTLERGVAEVAAWLKAEGLGDEAFDSRLFVRLKQLRYEVERGALDGDLRRVGDERFGAQPAAWAGA
jgi:nucleoside-diphosphate-sugar epimerase